MPSINIYPKVYKCKKCGEDCGFFPKDYDYKKELYPTICPLCAMPISQMIIDVFQEEGIIEVFKRIWIRISK